MKSEILLLLIAALLLFSCSDSEPTPASAPKETTPPGKETARKEPPPPHEATPDSQSVVPAVDGKEIHRIIAFVESDGEIHTGVWIDGSDRDTLLATFLKNEFSHRIRFIGAERPLGGTQKNCYFYDEESSWGILGCTDISEDRIAISKISEPLTERTSGNLLVGIPQFYEASGAKPQEKPAIGTRVQELEVKIDEFHAKKIAAAEAEKAQQESRPSKNRYIIQNQFPSAGPKDDILLEAMLRSTENEKLRELINLRRYLDPTSLSELRELAIEYGTTTRGFHGEKPASRIRLVKSVSLATIPVSITPSPGESVSLSATSGTPVPESGSGVLLSSAGTVIGLVRLNGKDRPTTFISAADLPGRIPFRMENPRFRIAIEGKEFDHQDVEAQLVTKLQKGVRTKQVELLVAPASESKLVELPNGETMISGKNEVSSYDQTGVFKDREDGTSLAKLNLHIQGRQGTIRFRGQVIQEEHNGTKSYLEPFEFTLKRYKNKVDELEWASQGPIKLGQYGEPEHLSRTILEPAEAVRSFSLSPVHSKLFLLTEEPAIRAVDLQTKQLSDQKIPVQSGSLMAAGAAGLFVYHPEVHVIERWNPERGELEKAALLETDSEVLGMATPWKEESASLFLATKDGPIWLDGETLRPRDCRLIFGDSSSLFSEKDWKDFLEKRDHPLTLVSASGDGRTFGLAINFEPPTWTSRTALYFLPDTGGETVRVYKEDGGLLGYSGRHVFHRSDVDGIGGHLGEYYHCHAQLLPNYGSAAVASFISAEETSFLPSSSQSVKTLVEASYGPGRSSRDAFLIPMSVQVPELGDFRYENDPEPAWRRAALAGDDEVLIALSADRKKVALYDTPIAEKMAGILETDALSIGHLPYMTRRGETLTHQFAPFKNINSLQLLESPPGAKLQEDGTLTWEVGSFDESSAAFAIEAISQSGESFVEEFEVTVKEGNRAYAEAGQKTGSAKSRRVYLTHSTVPLATEAKDLFLAGGGKYVGAILQKPPLLNLYDTDTCSLHLSLELPGEDVVAFANNHSVYLYSKEISAIERVPIDAPGERVSIPAPGDIIGLGTGWKSDREPLILLEKLPSKVIASETASMGNRTFTFTRSQGGGHAMELLEPRSLRRIPEAQSNEVADLVNQSYPFSWREFRTMPTSPNGRHAILGKQLLSFGDSGIFNIRQIETNIAFVENVFGVSDDGTHYLREGGYGRTDLDEEGRIPGIPVPVAGRKMFVTKNDNQQELLFFQFEQEDPVLTIKSFEEWDDYYEYPKGGRKVSPEKQFHLVPDTDLLVTLSRDARHLYFRKLDLDKLTDELGQ